MSTRQAGRFGKRDERHYLNRHKWGRASLDHAETGGMKTDYAEIVRRSLEPEQCVLIAVDIQEKLLPPIFEKDRLVKNSQLLIRLAGLLDIPVIVSTQYAKGLGGTVPQIASLMPTTSAIDKTMFSCFGSDVFCATMGRR